MSKLCKAIPSDDVQLFFDLYSHRYFESTTKKVLKAEYKMNGEFINTGKVCINHFYENLGLPKIEDGDDIGWTAFDCPFIDFEHEKIVMDDGLECFLIKIQKQF